MITITKSDKIRDGGCNACTRDNKKPFAPIFIIKMEEWYSTQSNSIKLCTKCLRELQKGIISILK